MVASLKDFLFTVSISGNVNHRIQIESTVAERCARKSQSCLLSIFMFVMIITSPAILFGIDETMPSEIPAAVIADWEKQDNVVGSGYSQVINQIISELPSEYADKVEAGSTQEAYINACHWRRVARMKPYSAEIEKIVYARHHNLGGPLVGFLEGIGMSVATEWESNSGLYLLEMDNYYPSPTALLEDTKGVVKDPTVSFDAKKILFAWAKNASGWGSSGFKIFEMEVNNPGNIRQLTDNPAGLTVSDIEPCYLQNGDITFNSSRIFGQVDCAYNQTCNLYLMNKDGKYLRRVGYDQVHTFYPVNMSDGKVMYTRWEYNDRTLMNCMGVFTMNPDATHQIELFGNQTTWPMTMIHARQIPNSDKIMAVASGHHAPYSGDLMIIDPNIARNGLDAIQFIAPYREPPSDPGWAANGSVECIFQNPLPFDEQNFLISWRPDTTSGAKYRIYFMNVDGTRELLAWDDNMSVSQPVLLKPRKVPPTPAYTVDYTKSTGDFMVQNVYIGSGMLTGNPWGPIQDTVEMGTVKKLRVIELTYRTNKTIGHTGVSGYVMTPVARHTGSWEAKTVLGETPVMEDGSAAFTVPARVPVYLQAIDANGCAVQTMRSWMVVQPGELFGCLGCHEDKNESPGPQPVPIANVPTPLEPFHGVENQPFSYSKIIQPILDKNCVSCHDASHSSGVDLRGDLIWAADLDPNLWADEVTAEKFFSTSYLSLTQDPGEYVNWVSIFSQAEGLRAYAVGSSKSELVKMLQDGHQGVTLTPEEMELICCWIDLAIVHSGTYDEHMTTESASAYQKALENRIKHEALEDANIQEFIDAGQYDSYIPVSVHQPENGEQFDITKTAGFQFLLRGRTLVLQPPGEGVFTLVDLRGRQVMNCVFGKEAGGTTSRTPLPRTLSAGLYVVRFSGSNITKNDVIMIIR